MFQLVLHDNLRLLEAQICQRLTSSSLDHGIGHIGHIVIVFLLTIERLIGQREIDGRTIDVAQGEVINDLLTQSLKGLCLADISHLRGSNLCRCDIDIFLQRPFTLGIRLSGVRLGIFTVDGLRHGNDSTR